MQDLLKYYGLDWVGFAGTLVSLQLLTHQRRSGFVLAMIASVAWATFGVLADSVPTAAANGVFCLMNLRAYLKWARRPAVEAGVVPART